MLALLFAGGLFLQGVAFCQGQPIPPKHKQFEATKAKAEKGDARAQFMLGEMYLRHSDVDNVQDKTLKAQVEQDDAEAVKWFRKAAQQGLADAQFQLGAMYDKGRGVKQDAAEAVEWFRKAAEQGFADAQLGLGAMYERGRGVKQDRVETYAWWNLAVKTRKDVAPVLRNLERQMTPQQLTEALKRTEELKTLIQASTGSGPLL